MTARQILRMQEVNLVADLLIAMKNGIKPKKSIRKYYDFYEEEKNYTDDVDVVSERFDNIIATIGKIYPEGVTASEFSRNHLFYSLFTAVAHCLYGLPGQQQAPLELSGAVIERARNGLDRVDEIFKLAADPTQLAPSERTFLQDSRRATTDEPVRKRRTAFLIELMR